MQESAPGVGGSLVRLANSQRKSPNRKSNSGNCTAGSGAENPATAAPTSTPVNTSAGIDDSSTAMRTPRDYQQYMSMTQHQRPASHTAGISSNSIHLVRVPCKLLICR